MTDSMTRTSELSCCCRTARANVRSKLTFDNGPDPEITPLVLGVLARRSIRTTFFVIGNKLSTREGRELARRAHEAGHWIGNHTWSHSVPLGLLEDASAIREEIRGTQEAIGALAPSASLFSPIRARRQFG
jgi:peptidoglycan/xylan/chitin deacetylase (PgdA/CDA1 family)